MTSDGKLTKEEIKNLKVAVKRDTNAVRIKGKGEIEDQVVETEIEAGNPSGREHSWLEISLHVMIEALEALADDLLGDDDEKPAQAK
jgi:hypothetical protein